MCPVPSAQCPVPYIPTYLCSIEVILCRFVHSTYIHNVDVHGTYIQDVCTLQMRAYEAYPIKQIAIQSRRIAPKRNARAPFAKGSIVRCFGQHSSGSGGASYIPITQVVYTW